MIDISTYLAFLAAAVVIILVPGPTNLAIVSDSIKAGVRRSLWTVAGAALSHALFIATATAGVGAILGRFPRVFVFIKWFGVLYLVAQGLRLIIGRQSRPEGRREEPPERGAVGYLIKGFVVNTTNPKALLFYAALFPPFVNAQHAYLPQLLVLASTFLAVFALVGVAHAVLGQRLGGLFSGDGKTDLANKVSGTVMIGAAVWMATK